MNFIDIIFIILLLLAAINGYKKGLVVEFASLAALILGIWGAFEFSDITAEFLVENFNWKWDHLNVASLIITFIVIVILVHIIAKEYGWSEKDILSIPYRRLFQYMRIINANSGGKVHFSNHSDEIKVEMMKKYNEKE